jgi:hypothetical protein
LTEWIRAVDKIIAWKLVAISDAILNLIHLSTGKHRTGTAQQPFLGGKFFRSLEAGSGTAGGTGSQQV